MACIALDPTLEALSKEYVNRVQFVTVDVDQHREIAQYFQIGSIPAVFIIEDKTVRTTLVGMRDKDTYRAALNEALKLAETRKQ
jgi:thioredoxin 1